MTTTNKLTWLASLRGLDVGHAEHRVLVQLMTYANGDGTRAHPGVQRLADDCRLDVRRTRRILRQLEERGLIVVAAEGGNQVGRGQSTEYRVPLTPDVRKGGKSDTEGGQNSHLKGGTGAPPTRS